MTNISIENIKKYQLNYTTFTTVIDSSKLDDPKIKWWDVYIYIFFFLQQLKSKKAEESQLN